MDYTYPAEGVRERLILAGLAELEEHGFTDFSLRRVASAAQVSCAAPYRHFKDKDELILEVIRYVREGWSLLCRNIAEVFASEPATRVVELAAAGIRFWLANGSFRSVLFGGMSGSDAARRAELALFDKPISDAVADLAAEGGLTRREGESLAYTVTALFWGTLVLAASSPSGADTGINKMKEKIKEILK
ncbi:MAG: TetR/AcrR family transcriptional regulator [Clostridia bacterium]|nr:TetR/AcrR family transcriptional regulator [Clostridia bacterium]